MLERVTDRRQQQRPVVEIRRPKAADWPRMLEILESANFHRIGGPEMPRFPLSDCFVAEVAGLVVGVAGYQLLDATTAKTSLLAVDPACRGRTIGAALQQARQDYLKARGITRLYTNVDDPQTLRWYCERFGYKPTGARIAKQESFGRSDIPEWTTIVATL